jgi:molybdate transport system substrate-binding protein
MTPRLVPGLIALLLAGLTGACAGQADATGSATSELTGTMTVYAAASLTAVFTALADEFEATHDGVDIQVQFAGSADLVTQVEDGAPADVLATADIATMDKAVVADLIAGDPVDFATNTLVIVVAPGNPHGIAGIADLADPDTVVVVCAPQVPCGAATRRATTAAGVTLTPASETNSVTDVMTAVTSGEADAGIVYVTDAGAAGDTVEAIEFPESAQAATTYRIGNLKGARVSALVQAFIAFVTGVVGQDALSAAGFAAP